MYNQCRMSAIGRTYHVQHIQMACWQLQCILHTAMQMWYGHMVYLWSYCTHAYRRYSSATRHCMDTEQIRLTILVQDHAVCLMLAQTRDRTEVWKLFPFTLRLGQLSRGSTTRRGYFSCTTFGATYVRSSLPGRACIRADRHNTTRTGAHLPEHAAGEIPTNCIHRTRPTPHPFAMPRMTKEKQSKPMPAKSEGRLKKLVSGYLSWFSFLCKAFGEVIPGLPQLRRYIVFPKARVGHASFTLLVVTPPCSLEKRDTKSRLCVMSTNLCRSRSDVSLISFPF